MSDRELCKHFGHLEDHQYKHFNRSLGVMVESKEHFKYLLDKGGYIPSEQANQLADKAKELNTKKYDGISGQAMEVCQAAKSQADKKCKLRIGTRLQKGMEKVGVSFDDRLPQHYRTKGGFDNG